MRFSLHVFTVAASAAFAGSAVAQSTQSGAWVPNGGGPMPNYFSGTNCRASGNAYAEPGPPGGFPVFMTAAELRIGGELAYAWVWTNTEPATISTSLDVMFDSTHWSSGTDLEVRFKAWDNLGRVYEAFDDAEVLNRATVYGRYDIDVHPLTWNAEGQPPAWVYGTSSWASVATVASKMAQMNIQVVAQETGMFWSA